MGRGDSGEDGKGVSTGLDFCIFVKLQVDCKVSNLQDSFRNSLHLTSSGKPGTYRPLPNFLRYRETPSFRFHIYKVTP